MSASATPDAVVTLGADASPFSAAIDGAEKALQRWGGQVLDIVADTGSRMASKWKAVGESLSSPIGVLAMPFKAAAAAADGVLTLATAPLKLIPVLGSAVASAIHGAYDAVRGVLGVLPALADQVSMLGHKAGEAIEHIAEKLGELATMTADEMAATLGRWSGDLSEWLAKRLFGPETAKKIGEFVGAELGDVLKDVLNEDVDPEALDAGLAVAKERAEDVARVVRRIGFAARETKSDFQDTWDNIRRDARQTVKEIATGFKTLKLGDLVNLEFSTGFRLVGIHAQEAFDKVEDYLGRVLFRIAAVIDRTVERFRMPLAAIVDAVQGLLERLGLITSGLGSWGDSIRNAADLGATLVTKVIGGVAYVTAEMTKLIGRASRLIIDLLEAVHFVAGRNLIDKAADGLRMLGGAAVAWSAKQVGAEETQQAAFEYADRSARQLRGEAPVAGDGIRRAQESLEAFAKRIDAMPSGLEAMQAAEAKARQMIEAGRKEAERRDAIFEQQRWDEWNEWFDKFWQQFDKEQEVVKNITLTAPTILANSREASNMIARAQTGGGGNPQEKMAQAAGEQLKKQERMVGLLESIDDRLGRAQIVGSV